MTKRILAHAIAGEPMTTDDRIYDNLMDEHDTLIEQYQTLRTAAEHAINELRFRSNDIYASTYTMLEIADNLEKAIQ